MIPENRVAIHPGEILLEEFLKPMGITQVQLARHIGVSLQRINEVCRGRRGITAETALLLADAFGTSAEVWIGMQTTYDLSRALQERKKRKATPIARLRTAA